MARRTSHSPLRPAHHHLDSEPHDDFGGLQRDLAATGRAWTAASYFALPRRSASGQARFNSWDAETARHLRQARRPAAAGPAPRAAEFLKKRRGSSKVATSQIALPKSASDQVYAQSGYAGSAANSVQVTLASDGVFSDGATLELATVTRSVATGLTATLSVAI